MKKIVLRSTAVFLLIFFVLIGGGIVALQSDWGTRKIVAWTKKILHKQGWEVDIQSVAGTWPDGISLQGISILSPQNDSISIRSLQTKFSPLGLLKKELILQDLQVDQIRWNFADHSDAPSSFRRKNSLPFSLTLSNFHLTDVQLPASSPFFANLSGDFKLHRHTRSFFVDIDFANKDNPETKAHLVLNTHLHSLIQLDGVFESPSFELLTPWMTQSIPAEGNLHIQFQALGRGASIFPLKGSAQITSDLHSFPSFPPLQRKWNGFFEFESEDNESWQIPYAQIEDSQKQFNAEGAALILADGSLQEADIQMRIQDISSFKLSSLSGPVSVSVLLKGSHTEAQLFSPRIDWKEDTLSDLRASFIGKWQDPHLKGSLKAQSRLQDIPIQLESPVIWEKGAFIKGEKLQLTAPFAVASGNFEFVFPSFFISDLDWSISSLNPVLSFFSDLPLLYGTAKGSIHAEILPEDIQKVEIEGEAIDLFSVQGEIKTLHFLASFLSNETHLNFQASHVKLGPLFFETASLELEKQPSSWPWRFESSGTWDSPFVWNGQGTLESSASEWNILVDRFTGTLFQEPLWVQPFQLTISPNHYQLKDFFLTLGNDTTLRAALNAAKENISLDLAVHQFPLNGFSLNSLNLSVQGITSFNFQFEEKNGRSNGRLKGKVENAQIASFGEVELSSAEAQFEATLLKETLKGSIEIQVENSPLVSLDASLPVQIEVWPQKWDWILNRTATAFLQFHGPIEDLLDFFNTGTHRLEGDCHCELHLANTLSRPRLTGYCTLSDGRYENYTTGIELIDLNADLFAKGSHLILRSFHAFDETGSGSIFAKGKLKALIEKSFPFHVDAEVRNLKGVDIEWLNAQMEANLHLEGDLSACALIGKAQVLEAHLTIPDRIPPSLPNLQVQYTHPLKPITEEIKTSSQFGYPVFFDVEITVPGNLFVSGYGLSSEWKGMIHLRGTSTDLEPKGELIMDQGQFVFSDRVFKLTKGSLTFSGTPGEMPLLDLAGSLDEKDITILASLQGPINSPQLTFQSIPPLPMGSILSHLLFGQDLSDLNVIQAAQLATSLASLSGGSSNILENTRRSLGIDRLRIIATPVGESGETGYAVQLGKYVAKGILISISQGTTDSSTNVSIEIDLAKGFMFQAESQQAQEQGKFTIKWNVNY